MPARARVLVLVENLSVPADRRVWAESRTLARAGYDVVVVCPTGEKRDLTSRELIDGVDIRRYPRRESGGGPLGYLVEYGWALWHMRRLTRQVARERPVDVVHVCNPPDVLFLAAGPARRRGARLLFDHHDLVPELFALRFGAPRGPLYRAAVLFERLTFRAANVVVSPNESYRRVAVNRGGKRPEDTFVVRIAPDLDRFRPGQPDPELKGGKPHLIAYAGTIGPQDGVDHALHALRALSRRRQDWRAVIAGAGDAAESVRRLAGELGLDGLVEFPGFLGDDALLRLLSTADICLAPEPSNPLNDVSTMIKVVEYMALQRPIVAFDLPETRFSAADGALYATPNEPDSYAACIERLLDDDALRSELGTRNRERVERELSWDRSASELLAAYERALSRGEARQD